MKPKHYWIEWDRKLFQAFIDTKPLQAVYSWKNIFRVVDYDKYHALESRHKKLVKALKFYGNVHFETIKGNKAREALEADEKASGE